MKQILKSLAPALVVACAVVSLSTVFAKAPPPDHMTRQEALVVQAYALKQQAFVAQVRQVQAEIKKAEEALEADPDSVEARGIAKRYGLGPRDSVDFKSGAITRAPASPDGGAPSK